MLHAVLVVLFHSKLLLFCAEIFFGDSKDRKCVDIWCDANLMLLNYLLGSNGQQFIFAISEREIFVPDFPDKIVADADFIIWPAKAWTMIY